MSDSPVRWYYSDGSSSFGPFDTSALRQLVSAGVIQPSYKVRPENDSIWQSLSTFDSNFESSQSPPPEKSANPSSPFHVSRNGQLVGVYSSADVKEKIRRLEISSKDLVWQEGMSDWQSVSSIPEIYPPEPLRSIEPESRTKQRIQPKPMTAGETLGLIGFILLIVIVGTLGTVFIHPLVGLGAGLVYAIKASADSKKRKRSK
ncbi:DUF4339 domain-containing protein [Luteolibacter sp. LG18]|uniref:DUF4339 domain-containing protein n=1 Tax=Luteolibacter sp. LG18 TaxID=2819286 RepID=UPI002B2D9356|nr:hypothetical protein llg_15810 [Luteolibacter sp. LG18]